MQRQRHPVVHDEPAHRRLLGRLDPVTGDAVAFGGGLHLGVERVEETVDLRLVEVGVVRHRRRVEHPVGVVEHDADVAQAPHARLGAHGGDADLDARVAEGALLGLAGLVVEVDLLVRAARDAHAPPAAAVLVHEHDAVLLALVDRAARARRGARGVEAVLADARQVEHEGLFELELHLVLDALEHRILDGVLLRAAEVVVPVGRPLDVHLLAAQQRVRRRHRKTVPGGRVEQRLVVVAPRLVVVRDARHLGVAEDARQLAQP